MSIPATTLSGKDKDRGRKREARRGKNSPDRERRSSPDLDPDLG